MQEKQSLLLSQCNTLLLQLEAKREEAREAIQREIVAFEEKQAKEQILKENARKLAIEQFESKFCEEMKHKEIALQDALGQFQIVRLEKKTN